MENKAKGPIAPAPHASSLLPLKAPQASEQTAASFIKCPLTAAESRRRAPRGCRKGAGTFWTSKTRKKKKKVMLNKNAEYKQAQSSLSHKTVTQKLNRLKLLLVQKQKHHNQQIVDTKT